MHSHITFHPVPSRRGTWLLTAIWDHVLRERIPDLEFVSEDQALSWVNEHAEDWLAGRKSRGSERLETAHTRAPSAEIGQVVSMADAVLDEQPRSIDLTAPKYDCSLQELIASDVSTGMRLEAAPSASTAPQSFDVTPGRIKRMAGVLILDSPERSR